MAQWFAQLLFRGDQLLGEGLDDFAEVSGIQEGLEGERYTAIVVSGYALYGELRGFYSLGVSHIRLDPSTQKAFYTSEDSSLHKEPVDSLTPSQKSATRDWLTAFSLAAWENSTETFKLNLLSNGSSAER